MQIKIEEPKKVFEIINIAFKNGCELGLFFYPHYDFEGTLSFCKFIAQIPPDDSLCNLQFKWITGNCDDLWCYKFKFPPEKEIEYLSMDLGISIEEAEEVYIEKLNKDISSMLSKYADMLEPPHYAKKKEENGYDS